MKGADSQSLGGKESAERPRRRRKRVLLPGAAATLIALLLGAAWLGRERIASNVVDGQLAALDLPATYEIGRITGARQVLRNVVIGDPANPDLTVDQVEVRLRYRLGVPGISSVTLVNPRLRGRLVDGRVSFGALDKVIYRQSDKAPALPDIDLAIRDGRALLRTPWGPVGAKLEGAGLLSGGFEGTLALAAPQLVQADCALSDATLFGTVTTSAGKPEFSGPLRWQSLKCPSSDIAFGHLDANIEGGTDAAFTGVQGKAALAAGPFNFRRYGANGADGTVRGRYKGGLLDISHTIAARGVATPQARAALTTIRGTLRASDGFSRLELRDTLEGGGLRPGPAFEDALGALARVGEGTLLSPLATRFASALGREARGSSLTADIVLRRNGEATTILVPQAEMRGGSGARVLSLSRVESNFGVGRPTRLSGNLATGGRDMPRITGRMESGEASGAVFRLVMQPYQAQDSILAIPQLTVAQSRGGLLRLAGQVRASGPLPGGAAQNLTLPIDGRWTPGGGFSLWDSCTDVAFDRLQISSLTLAKRSMRLCPPSGRSIVSGGDGPLRIAAGTTGLDLEGTLGETPIRIASGPVGFAYPGVMSASRLAVGLGPEQTASRFEISNLTATLDGADVAGNFTGADIRLNAVPLDLRDSSGSWRFAGGRLALTDGDFRLVDRQAQARFEPLEAKGGTLTLQGNVITAEARLRNPKTQRVVTDVSLRHDLSSGRGFADLSVPGLLFDKRLQPVQISRLTKGVIANAAGTVTGTGRIDWNGSKVSSTGRFSSDSLDFAAAFGPVKAASGTIVFSDLLGLTTAPGQTLRVGSVNPGVEVTDGEFTFQLRGGQLLAVEGGSWPFMGGRLTLRSVDLNFGASEERRYVFDVEGLDAAEFVARFEIPNIAATGIFDGTVPIVFDQSGNGRIMGGQLVSRTPGGNVSYVGDLSYKDLSTMANFAFDALRSLDYSQMRIGMNGSLTGEIVTSVDIDGVKQGEGAKRNIVTRALASLPIQFRINVRAPFYQFITSFKSLRDPASVRDPREIGLLSNDGKRLAKPEVRGEDLTPEDAPDDVIPDESPVQN